MKITILPSRNQAWGFFGTISRIEDSAANDPEKAWRLASEAVTEATGGSPEGVRDFLDSRNGRHFADDVHNELFRGTALDAAIDAAVARWMGWRIGRRISRETGIPAGLPYLTGFVTRFEIEAEANMLN